MPLGQACQLALPSGQDMWAFAGRYSITVRKCSQRALPNHLKYPWSPLDQRVLRCVLFVLRWAVFEMGGVSQRRKPGCSRAPQEVKDICVSQNPPNGST